MNNYSAALKKINQLIALNRLLDAADELLVWAEPYPDIYDDLVHLKGNFSASKKKYNLDQIDYEQLAIQQNKIREALLDLKKELESLQKLEEPRQQEFHIEVSNLINIGRERIRQHEFGEAMDCFQDALRLNPTHTEALFYRGITYIALGQLLDAFDDFSKIIDNPKLKRLHPFALINRGVVALHLGQNERAKSDWMKVKELGYPVLVKEYLEDL